MIIDSHSHVILPVEKHLSIMEKEGIDKTILFSTSIHPETATNYSAYKNELLQLYKILRGEVNTTDARIRAIKELKETVNAHPDKFIGFGSCPIGLNLNETDLWIKEHVTANSFKGIGEFTFGEGQVYKSENIFRSVADNLNYPLWFHTFHPLTGTDIKELLNLAKKYPSVPVILGHGAGHYWLEIIEEISDKQNVYFDISASFTIHSVKIAAELIPERVLFSIDLPYGSPAVMKKIVDESVPDSRVRELIFSENIKRLITR
jgi:uncharacterized protein